MHGHGSRRSRGPSSGKSGQCVADITDYGGALQGSRDACNALIICGEKSLWEGWMKFPRPQFLHLAVGAIALPAASQIAQGRDVDEGRALAKIYQPDVILQAAEQHLPTPPRT